MLYFVWRGVHGASISFNVIGLNSPPQLCVEEDDGEDKLQIGVGWPIWKINNVSNK